jgi:hypothetical protein
MNEDLHSLSVAIEDLRTDTRTQINELRQTTRQDLRESEGRIMDRLDRLADEIRSSSPWPSSRVA